MVQKYHYVICFLMFFYVEGCRIVERSRAEHDWHAVGSQFISHHEMDFGEVKNEINSN